MYKKKKRRETSVKILENFWVIFYFIFQIEFDFKLKKRNEKIFLIFIHNI